MAATYLFHIVRRHPFVDGNKRTGLIAALAFLGLNDLQLYVEADAVVELVMGVAAGGVGKAGVDLPAGALATATVLAGAAASLAASARTSQGTLYHGLPGGQGSRATTGQAAHMARFALPRRTFA